MPVLTNFESLQTLLKLLKREMEISLVEERPHTHTHISLSLYIYIYIYINSQSLEKIQLDFNWILNFAPRVSSNF